MARSPSTRRPRVWPNARSPIFTSRKPSACLSRHNARNRSRGSEISCVPAECAYIAPCPNRTCLWSCVGGWRSGQEAGEPSLIAGSRSEPVNPAKRGTRLKATTDRAFSSLSASNADLPKRLVSLAGRADRGAHPKSNRWLRSLGTGSSPCGALSDPRRSIWFGVGLFSESPIRTANGIVTSSARLQHARAANGVAHPFAQVRCPTREVGTKGCRDDAENPRLPPRPP